MRSRLYGLSAIAFLLIICLSIGACKQEDTSEIGRDQTSSSSDKYGYIDKEGKFVIKPQFEEASSFSEGLAAFKEGDKWGYIDLQGDVVIEPRFDVANSFHDGLARVYLFDEGNGYIDRNGDWAIPPEKLKQYDDAPGDPVRFGEFHEGLAEVGYRNHKCGFIDKSGDLVIPRILEGSDAMTVFSEGLAAASIEEGECGYIDTNGCFMPLALYDSAGEFSEGLAGMGIGNKHGYMDRGFNIVIEPQFREAYPFSEGLANVVTTDGKRGFIDKSGVMVIELPDSYDASKFSEGLGVYIYVDDAGTKQYEYIGTKKYGYIDKTGNVVIEPQFSYAESFSDGVALVKVDSEFIGP